MTAKEIIKTAEHLNSQARIAAERVKTLSTTMDEVDEIIAAYDVPNEPVTAPKLLRELENHK